MGGTQIASEFRWNRRNKPENKTIIITEMRNKIVAKIFGKEGIKTSEFIFITKQKLLFLKRCRKADLHS